MTCPRNQMAPETQALWHYSKLVHLPNILGAGTIRRASLYVPKGEKTAVWLSKNSEWEGTALRREWKNLIDITPVTPIRFRLDTNLATHNHVRLYSWEEHKQISGIRPRKASELEEAGRFVGADSSEWMCSYKDLSLDFFQPFEVYFRGRWMSDALFRALAGEMVAT